MKKKPDEEELKKMVNLTKLIKKDNVKVEPKAPERGPNKWRSYNPKYAPKPEIPAKPEGLVEAGGMQVDPARAEEYENWQAAIRLLSTQDHYLLVMTDAAKVHPRPPGDFPKLLGTALAIVTLVILLVFVSLKYNWDFDKYWRLPRDLVSYMWLVLTCAFVAYWLVRLTLGEERTNKLVGKSVNSLAKLIRIFRHQN